MNSFILPLFRAPSIFVLLLAGMAAAEPKAPETSPEKSESTLKNDKPENGDAGKKADKDEKKDKPKISETKHSIALNGTKIDYTATAGSLPLKDAEGKTTAEIFYTAYVRDSVSDLTKRPVTFSFNGGPGSSSVWMHMGLLGPKRVKMKDDGGALPPPYEIVENEHSLLDETDLVFIDPVGTGFSHAAKPEEAKKFYGVKEDARSVAEFIRLYVTRNTRWASPKFIIGESYGTTRAAALSGELMDRHRMNLNGIMLVSAVLNFQTIYGGEGNDLPHVLFLPSYTAAAWHHQKLPSDLQGKPLVEVLKMAEQFAVGDYNHALTRGTALEKPARDTTLKQLARFTGLSVNFLDRANLRPSLSRFSVELLREKDLQIGRFDSRYTSLVRDRLTESMEADPSADAVFSAYTSTFNHYLRTELKYEEDKPYEILSNVRPWNWDSENKPLNVAETLAESMTRNPFLKVHISCGYSDLATPYFAARYTFEHMNLPAALKKNLVLDDYAAGHMMYLNLPDLKKQKADLAKFVRGASGK